MLTREKEVQSLRSQIAGMNEEMDSLKKTISEMGSKAWKLEMLRLLERGRRKEEKERE